MRLGNLTREAVVVQFDLSSWSKRSLRREGSGRAVRIVAFLRRNIARLARFLVKLHHYPRSLFLGLARCETGASRQPQRLHRSNDATAYPATSSQIRRPWVSRSRKLPTTNVTPATIIG